MGLFAAFSINDTEHNTVTRVVVLSLGMLRVTFFIVILNAECHYAECQYA
jgi:hypothetical protein